MTQFSPEIVERVARAIAQAEFNFTDGNVMPKWSDWRDHARAAIEALTGKNELTAPAEEIVETAARQALLNTEVARTAVVNPVNGTRPYTYVQFHGQPVVFNEGEFEIAGDAGSGRAAAYATTINAALFELAKQAARAALTKVGCSDGEYHVGCGGVWNQYGRCSKCDAPDVSLTFHANGKLRTSELRNDSSLLRNNGGGK